MQDIVLLTKGVLRSYDLMGRYGGEEFTVPASDISETDAKNLAERMKTAVSSRAILFEDKEIPVSASFGVAPVNSRDDLQNAIANADKALCAAKRGGRNSVMLYEIKMEELPVTV